MVPGKTEADVFNRIRSMMRRAAMATRTPWTWNQLRLAVCMVHCLACLTLPNQYKPSLYQQQYTNVNITSVASQNAQCWQLPASKNMLLLSMIEYKVLVKTDDGFAQMYHMNPQFTQTFSFNHLQKCTATAVLGSKFWDSWKLFNPQT